MTIYVVLSAGPSQKLSDNIQRVFPGDDHHVIAPNQWLISTDKLSSTISSELEIANGQAGVLAVIFRIAGPGVGWHTKTLWEWLTVKSAPSG